MRQKYEPYSEVTVSLVLVTHLLAIAYFKNSSGFPGFEFCNFNLSEPVLFTFAKFHDFVFLCDEFDRIRRVSVLCHISVDDFLFPLKFGKFILSFVDVLVFLCKVHGFLLELLFHILAFFLTLAQLVFSLLEFCSSLSSGCLFFQQLFVFLINVLNVLFVFNL